MLVFRGRVVCILQQQADAGAEEEKLILTRPQAGGLRNSGFSNYKKKRSNAFGLNVKQQQVLNTSMCPLAAIKPSREKKRERDEILSKSFSSQRVPELVPYVFYTGQNRAVWALLDSATWVTFENN